MYRPLPDELTIKSSPIEGLGLFATKEIKANTFIGITHIRDCLLYTSPSPRDLWISRMPSSA